MLRRARDTPCTTGLEPLYRRPMTLFATITPRRRRYTVSARA